MEKFCLYITELKEKTRHNLQRIFGMLNGVGNSFLQVQIVITHQHLGNLLKMNHKLVLQSGYQCK